MFVVLMCLVGMASAMYENSNYIQSSVATIHFYNPEETGIHMNGDPLILRNGVNAQLCITTPASVCSYSWPGSSKCLSISPDCTCYNWKFAGMGNVSSVVAHESIATPSCAEFFVRENDTVTFRWDLQGEWPAISPGLATATGDLNLETLEKYCPRKSYGFGGCYVEHTVQFLLMNVTLDSKDIKSQGTITYVILLIIAVIAGTVISVKHETE